ncbi:hypothetical protein K227x_51000 [Rubripirellula lacrimiformis]|uniref:Uncharacterized protein n=1 Tax=Rubripirellula lacrimiformis TaxID=1930273 RepID=A0A517NHS2_9BACT|nr:hypothetical protein [Rubripirellula lacrimiformis]QDT06684.1 hypothetical protein K227x_51000 [Rubripirellula lacrimiformis]
MNDQHENRSAIPHWITVPIQTNMRCHLLGSVIVMVLVVMTWWMAKMDLRSTTTTQIGQSEIDLIEAAEVVRSADQLRQRHAAIAGQHRQVRSAASSLILQVPESVGWQDVQTRLVRLSQENSLFLVHAIKGETHVGGRVGVITGRCEVRGVYADLCRFLSQLSEASPTGPPLMIGASEIDITRDIHSVDDQGRHECTALLKIRVPYAAAGTSAEKLGRSTKTKSASTNQPAIGGSQI